MDLTKKPTAPRVRAAPTHEQRRRARRRSAKRRDLLRDNNICINGQLPQKLVRLVMRRHRLKHGPPIPGKGGRCARCAAIHAASRSRSRTGTTVPVSHRIREIDAVTTSADHVTAIRAVASARTLIAVHATFDFSRTEAA